MQRLCQLFTSKQIFNCCGVLTGYEAPAPKKIQIAVAVKVGRVKASPDDRGLAPARSFGSVEEFEEYFQEYGTLLIDGEEQPIQRPLDEDSQRDHFSGKKKARH